MIELYFAPTANAYRAALALAECGLAYRVHRLDFAKGDHKSPEYLKVNPFGAIPAIVDPDGPAGKPLTLSQSGAILLYAAEKTGRFLPPELAARASVMQWFCSAISDAAPAGTAIYYASARLPEKSDANTAFFESRFVGMARVYDARLAEHEWLAGDLSVADLALYPAIAAGQKAIARVGGLPHLARWTEQMAARPGVRKAYAA